MHRVARHMLSYVEAWVRRIVRVVSTQPDIGTTKISAPYHPQHFREGLEIPKLMAEDDSAPYTEKQRCETGPGFQFMSDLHLEQAIQEGQYGRFDIPKSAPYLILAGDIGRFHDKDAFRTFLRHQCDKFERVMLVPGNHEFYRSSRREGLAVAEAFRQDLGEKFVFMHRERVDLGDTVVLGCTLHSCIPDNPEALTNDFECIQSWRVVDHNNEYAEDRNWLQQALAEVERSRPECRVIIVTHYAPAFAKTVPLEFERNKYSHCFCSDTLASAQEWAGVKQVSHWIFGHTHHNARFDYEGVWVISNQPSARTGRPFDEEATI